MNPVPDLTLSGRCGVKGSFKCPWSYCRSENFRHTILAMDTSCMVGARVSAVRVRTNHHRSEEFPVIITGVSHLLSLSVQCQRPEQISDGPHDVVIHISFDNLDITRFGHFQHYTHTGVGGKLDSRDRHDCLLSP